MSKASVKASLNDGTFSPSSSSEGWTAARGEVVRQATKEATHNLPPVLSACCLGLIGQIGGGLPLRASAKDGVVELSSGPPFQARPGMNSLAIGLRCEGEGGGERVEVGRGGEEVSWGRRSWILSGLSGWYTEVGRGNASVEEREHQWHGAPSTSVAYHWW